MPHAIEEHRWGRVVYARSKALLPVQGYYGVLLHTPYRGRTEAHVMHVALETTYTIVRYAVMIPVLQVEKLPLSCASPPADDDM